MRRTEDIFIQPPACASGFSDQGLDYQEMEREAVKKRSRGDSVRSDSPLGRESRGWALGMGDEGLRSGLGIMDAR